MTHVPTPGKRAHIWDAPKNVNRLLRVFYFLCVVLVSAGLRCAPPCRPPLGAFLRLLRILRVRVVLDAGGGSEGHAKGPHEGRGLLRCGLTSRPSSHSSSGPSSALPSRGRIRSALLLGIPVSGGLNLSGPIQAFTWRSTSFQYTLTPLRVDRLSLLFGYLFHIATFIGNLFALHLKREDDDTLQHAAAFLYAGSALGAVFAGDFLTLFVFWELLAFTFGLPDLGAGDASGQ